MNFSKIICLGLLGLPNVVLASGSEADKNENDSVVALREVVVHGNNTKPLQEQNVGMLNLDIPLKFLPMTVSKLDGETLQRKHIVNLEDASKYLPGVIMSSNQLGAFQRYSIRGTSDAVIAYDGIRDERSLTNTVPFGDLSNVESIEVIKGPASILAGHSVMGGVINIIRKRPNDKFGANAHVSYGSWKQIEAGVDFGGKLVGPVNYLAHFFYNGGDGYRMVNANRLSGMFTLGSQITSKGYLEASINFANDSYTTDIGGAPTMPADIYYTGTDKLFLPSGSRNPFCDYENVYNDLANNYMKRKYLEVLATYTHKFADFLNLRERFSYSHSDLDYCAVEGMSYLTSTEPIYDYWYTNPRNQQITYVNLDSVRSGTPLCFNPDHKILTNTLDFTGKIKTGQIINNYNLGWTFSYFNFTQYNGYGVDDVWGPGVGEIVSVSNPHYVRDWWDSKVSAAQISHYTTNGLYLTDVIDINDHWKGMLSGRIDWYRYKRATATISDGKQHYNEADRTDWDIVSTSAFTYRVGAVYLPIPEVSIYGSAASYFKPYNTFYNPDYIYYDRNGNEYFPGSGGGEVYRPEKGNQFEIGVRYENKFFDINASVYYIRKFNVVKNLGKMPVEENGETVEKTVQAQVGRATSKGFDFDIAIHPLRELSITSGFSYSDYRTIASNMDWAKDLPWVTLNEDGTINLPATGVPRTTFYAYGDYTITRGPLKSLSFHLSCNLMGKIYQDVTNNVYDPPRAIVDLGLYYTVNKYVDLSFLINNLFNNHYFTSATRLGKPINFMASIYLNI